MRQSALFEPPHRTRYSPPEPPDVCRQRHLGSDESEAANRLIHPRKEVLRGLILDAIRGAGPRGMTSHEVVAVTGIPLQTVSGRLAELKAENLIVPNGARRHTPSGASAAVLVVKEAVWQP